jgi:hypothetical protein
LQVSGLKVAYDMSKPLFGRVSPQAWSRRAAIGRWILNDTTTCYKVSPSAYVAGLLGAVEPHLEASQGAGQR